MTTEKAFDGEGGGNGADATQQPLTRDDQHGDDDVEQSTTGEDGDDIYKSPAPDGGWRAWMALLSSWCMLFCTFGMINCKRLLPRCHIKNHKLTGVGM